MQQASSCTPTPRYSSVRCVDAGPQTFVGTPQLYAFWIHNRTCLYRDLTWNRDTGRMEFHASPDEKTVSLPRVTLSPRSFDLMINPAKRRKQVSKMWYYHDWAPEVVRTPVPCEDGATELPGLHLYYSPIVAPWNYAHTLLCDLFGLFWSALELGFTSADIANATVVAVGRHYFPEFPLPDPKRPNAAFRLFSRVPPTYDVSLPSRTVIRNLVAGTGTKSWSWVTEDYAAAGSRELWWQFRQHIIDTTGATDRQPTGANGADEPPSGIRPSQRRPEHPPGRKLRVSVCHKKDKRGVVNYDEAVDFLRRELPSDVEVVLESAVGRSPAHQVQMFLDMDVYICNEGTLATSFFLMPPGSAFVSLPLVYHGPHLHQISRGNFKWSHPSEWWREPDKMRPDPRKNTGGNIDWFAPSIPWVNVSWYDIIPLNETKIQLPLGSLRNYMPEFNIVLQKHRLLPLVLSAVAHVKNRRAAAVPDSPNYSINAGLCRDLLHRTPALVRSFNTGKCYYSMSWLCEMWTNTHYRWRLFHEKWRLSKGHCGNDKSWPPNVGLVDPRESDPARPLEAFLFYTRERLAAMYNATDMGNFHPEPEDLKYFPEEGSL